MNAEQRLVNARAEAERKAWDALARYKFMMFGYWAGKWVSFNQLCATSNPNPFTELVKTGRREATPLRKGDR